MANSSHGTIMFCINMLYGSFLVVLVLNAMISYVSIHQYKSCSSSLVSSYQGHHHEDDAEPSRFLFFHSYDFQHYFSQFSNLLPSVNAQTCFSKAWNDASVCTGHGFCTGADTCYCNDMNSNNMLKSDGSNILYGGNSLTLYSNYYYLQMQPYGNLVLYDNTAGSYPYWMSGTHKQGSAPYELRLESTGRLAIYGNNVLVREINPACEGQTAPFRLVLEANGLVAIYSADAIRCWDTGTADSSKPSYYAWVDSQCSTPVCWGLNATDPTVCSGRGNCTSPHSCSCISGTGGSRCEYNVCNGIYQYSYGVCSNHGSCTGPNTCTCSGNYEGTYCNEWSCNSIKSTNTTYVCSGHGTCYSPNYCICNGGYSGSNCETHYCYSVLNSNPSVCSGHGKCLHTDVCQCSTGYYGSTCDSWNCNGISKTLVGTVCSGVGTCTAPDTCSCNEGRYGSNCEAWNCNGIIFNSTSVCSSHGTCTGINTCSCQTGYYGNNCENHQCNGKVYNASDVCSGNGVCSSPNNCTCNSGYSGSDCEIFSCNGILKTNPTVCSGNGTCSSFNNCTCNTGYYGTNCEFYDCSGLLYNSTDVCLRRGQCIRPNTCSCNTGYYGNNCELFTCDGIAHTNTSYVCGGHGSCNSYNNCTCQEDYYGKYCTSYYCFGIENNSTLVCSTNGTCSSPDNCTCKNGFYGSMCENYDCFGFEFSESGVCSGAGQCLGPNHCSCNLGNYGPNCQYYTCGSVLYNMSNVCSGHGVCDSYNNCTCDAEYFGTYCSQYECFGHENNDTLACSGHGVCSSPHNCTCNEGYYGMNCEFFNCSGVVFSDGNVCSGNGACVKPNNCSCLHGYYGSNCELYQCNGTLFNQSNVCSGHGACFAYNNCSCDAGYYGDFCNEFDCFGFEFKNAMACSGNGTCLSPDNCTCRAGYYGAACELYDCYGVVYTNASDYLCYGLASNSTNVCNGHGDCTGPNNCSCKFNFYGATCDLYNCFGVLYNSSNVCSGRGVCHSHNNCSCNSTEYYGPNCDQFSCFDIHKDNSSYVCSGHGVCATPNNCSCMNGYYGDRCQFFECHGSLFSNTSVCSGHGTCQSPNNCSCLPNYSGSNCQDFDCFGINSTSSSACNGKGHCIDFNNCSCNAGWFGSSCSLTSCFGVASSNSSVCSGKGSCFAPDNCTCVNGYYGDNCQFHDCQGTIYSNSSVCSGKGTCSGPNQCSCSQGYYGARCEYFYCNGKLFNDSMSCNMGTCVSPNQCICKPGYYSMACDMYNCSNIPFNSSNVCSGHGSCQSPNNCSCMPNYSGPNCQEFQCFGLNSTSPSACNGHGHCIDFNNCSCLNGYYGDRCQFFECSGSLFTNASVCSGHGTCLSSNNCSCLPNYSGSNCQDFKCFGINSTSPSACNGKGHCIDFNTCSCSAGWFGSSCSITSCFGIASNLSSVCSGKGSCSSPDVCSCQKGYYDNNCQMPSCFSILANMTNVCNGKGSCVGLDTCSCSEGFTASDCSVTTLPLTIFLKKSQQKVYQNITYLEIEIFSNDFEGLDASKLSFSWVCENCTGVTNASIYMNQTASRILIVNPSMLLAPATYSFFGNVTYDNGEKYPPRLSNAVKFTLTVLPVPIIDVNVPSLEIFGLPSAYVRTKLEAGQSIEAIVSKVSLNQTIVQSFLLCDGNCSSPLTYHWRVSANVNGTAVPMYTSTGATTGATTGANNLLFSPAITMSTSGYISSSSSIVMSLAVFNSQGKNMTGTVSIPIIQPARPPVIVVVKNDTTTNQTVIEVEKIVSVVPTQGTALTDQFTIAIQPWNAPEELLPLSYAIGFYDPNTGKPVRLTEFSTNTSLSVYLPFIKAKATSSKRAAATQEIKLVVFVMDALGNIDSQAEQTLPVQVAAFNGTSEQLLEKVNSLSGAALTVAAYDQSITVVSANSGGNSSELVYQLVKKIEIDPKNPAGALATFEALTSTVGSVNPGVVTEITTKLTSFVNSIEDLYNQEIKLYGFVKSKLSATDVTSSIAVTSNLLSSGVGADQTVSVTSKLASMVLLGEVPKVLNPQEKELPKVSFSTPLINITISSFKLSGPVSGNQTLSSGETEIGLSISSIMSQYNGYSKNSGTSLISYSTLPYSNNYTRSNPSTSIAVDFKYLQDATTVPLKDLAQPIILSFKISLDSKNITSNNTFSCRYYDESKSSWSESGCTLHSVDLASGTIQCACTHTTMFSTFLEQKTQVLPPVVRDQVASLYFAQIAFGVFYFIASSVILILLIVYRKEQPVSSRLVTPYLGMAALMIESLLVYIIQRGVLVGQLLSSDSQMWEAGDTAANVIANIVAIVVNTMNLTAILSYVMQVFRFQFMKYLYQLIAESRGDEKKSERILKALRYCTSTGLFVTIVVVFAIINLCYWTLWVILRRTNAISASAYTYIVSISYTLTAFVFSVIIIGVTIFDFIGSQKVEKERKARAVGKKRESNVFYADNGASNTKKEYTNPLVGMYRWFISLDGPLYFRMEMILYIVSFSFLFLNQVIGLSSLSFRFESAELFQKALTVDGVSFIFEVLYVLSYLLVFGGYTLLVLLHYKTRSQRRNREKQKSQDRQENSQQEITATQVNDGEEELVNKDMSIVLDSEEGYHLFEAFCEKEFSLENIYLYTDLRSNKSITYGEDLAAVPKFLSFIYNTYIMTGATTEVNIPSKCRNSFLYLYKNVLNKQQEARENFQLDIENLDKDIKVATKNTPVPMFDIDAKSVRDCFNTLNRQILVNLGDTFSRFVFSPEYVTFSKAYELQQVMIDQANVVYLC
ncbi:hypothetical protein C9374_005800 [Naegleria lovaniensis]|uniref:Uncharacterized protein n=1 Tax=Naegleria lovaniensis TaxID=51637 RepID=A0AA88KJM2_NAELO|nr:uncharacterized protein C9374_005800 [Naegleria lovaniensis]KAG2382008.1 hypothetical protein C9374_005800 [Naegleria lovaniensis]